MKTYTKAEVVEIARRHSVSVAENWSGPGQLWPLIERMRAEGSVIVLKLDGLRKPPKDNGQYTVVATGGCLGEQSIHGDFNTLDEALCYLIGNYEDLAK